MRNGRNRRGMSLLIVMLAISMSLVLTYSFLRTQSTALQVSRNGMKRDLALQAAQTGAAVAVQSMDSPAWSGVDKPISQTVYNDADGTAAYTVRYSPLASEDGQTLPDDASLYVVVLSTGSWQSASNQSERVERRVEVIARLQPRVPGRSIRAGDLTSASDLSPNPGDYDAIQAYALFSSRGTNSLALDPRDRIDGNIWLYDNLVLYQDPQWSSSIRNQALEDIGNQYVSVVSGKTVTLHPHPLAGAITFYQKPSGSVRNDLDRVAVAWSQTASQPKSPSIDFSGWQRYRLYAGGFEYRAAEVDSTLRDKTLRPTPDNPLGVFYRKGSLRLRDNVTIQGTLVVDGDITLDGDQIHVSGFDWRTQDGQAIVGDRDYWPRLPAIVASNLYCEREASAVIDGAVVVRHSLTGAGGIFEYASANNADISGTATARPLQQPWSTVQLGGKYDLSAVNDRGDYAVWLADKATGAWYTIVGVDRTKYQLTVRGEVRADSATPFRIRRNRRNFLDVRGPVAGETHNINRTDAWASVGSISWSLLYWNWKDDNSSREREGLPTISWIDWLADGNNYSGWSSYYREYGLGLEPTFHLKRPDGIKYRWSPPLFQSFQAKGQNEQYAGYRWKVTSWRELP